MRCGDVSALVVDGATGVVAIMVPHPIAQIVVRTGFVAALRREVEVHIGADQHFVAAAVSGIGMEDVAGGVFIEDAVAGEFLADEVAKGVVVVDLAGSDFVVGIGDVIVVVEIVGVGRNPLEPSAHALLQRRDFGERRA